jgi:hypothetical protein
VREIVRPDTTPETDWIGRTTDLIYDRDSGHLFGVNYSDQVIFEATRDGELVRTYGRRGEGPGELKNAHRLMNTRGGIVAFDLGNMKLIRFERGSDRYVEGRLDHYYYDFAVGPKDEIYAIPGWGGEAIAVLGLDGRVVRGIGERSLIPGTGVGFRVSALDDGGFVLVDTDLPELILLDPEGAVRRLVDTDLPELILLDPEGAVRRRVPLHELPLMKEWKAEEDEIMGRRPGLIGGKTWVPDIEPIDASTFVVAVSPPRPFDRGRQLWMVDLDSDLISRYGYDVTEVGSEIALAGSSVFTFGLRDGALREYRIPDGR